DDLPVEGARGRDARPHSGPRHDRRRPRLRGLVPALSYRMGRLDRRTVPARVRVLEPLPRRHRPRYGLADAGGRRELHHHAAHVRERRAVPELLLPAVDAGDLEREPDHLLRGARPKLPPGNDRGLVEPRVPARLRVPHAGGRLLHLGPVAEGRVRGRDRRTTGPSGTDGQASEEVTAEAEASRAARALGGLTPPIARG